MPTSFPTGLDSFTNPAATDDVSVVTHDTQHANANDAIKALETKVGINSSADTSSIDYILTNLASLVSSITIDSLLPSQTGQSGNFLTTDGTSASWAALGTAAFSDTSAFDAAGAAASALSSAQAYTASALAAFTGTANITTLGTIATGTWAATTLAIAHGGTGQTTAAAALNALLPSQTGQSGNFLTTDGTNSSWAAAGGGSGSGADPTASVGLTAVNGSATTFLRSDGAPALDVSIAPTWTGQHILANAATIFGAGDNTGSLTGATLRGPNASGSNVAGVDTIIQGSLATGNAASGSLVFKTGAIGSSGSTSQTATTALTLDEDQNATFSGDVNVSQAMAANTSNDGIVLINTSPSSSGNYQFSPRLRLSGQTYGGTPGNQLDFIIENQPNTGNGSGSGGPAGDLVIRGQIGNNGYSDLMRITTTQSYGLTQYPILAIGNIQLVTFGYGGAPTLSFNAGDFQIYYNQYSVSGLLATNSIQLQSPGTLITNTSAGVSALTIQGATSQSAAMCQLQGTSSTTAGRPQAEIDTAWNDMTDATRSADLVLRAYYTSSALEGVRVRGTSGGAAIAFLGGTPAVQQANASQTAITAVLDANAKSALQAIYDLLVAYNLAPATA